MNLQNADKDQLTALEKELAARFEDFKQMGLKLDLTRGKPSADQLSLANALDGALNGNYIADDGTDTRNYGGLDGLPAMKTFGAELLGVDSQNILVGGNSSLTLMYYSVLFCWLFGASADATPWSKQSGVKFLCPSPGYDRHFAICEDLGVEMIPVTIGDDGPDMDQVESLVKNDSSIKGIWCVPKYSNPTGCVYSAETVQRLAKIGAIAAPDFRVFYDNAYVVHDLTDEPPVLENIWLHGKEAGTEDAILQFASTSKVTFAGAGVSFLAASASNLTHFKQHLGMATIGPDKVNQLRHLKVLDSIDTLKNHMRQHADILNPRFDCVLNRLAEGLDGTGIGNWTKPSGGYFVSFDAPEGTAKEIVRLAGEAGVKLTPAGASFPYGNDPRDSNIRLAPSFPGVEEIDKAMQVFVVCVKLATARKMLAG
ncbi:MAG: aminotransferase class I/II-fold pyridoxal phosphate-dependent enzyme [bacterium]